jgi:membrane-bound serine protease (ClpP class)
MRGWDTPRRSMIARLHVPHHRLAPALVLLGLLLAVGAGVGRAGAPEVVQLTADGVVDNVMASYIADGVAGATRSGAAAVVIELNTPGGSLDATTAIKTALLEASVPTIVWVAPAGGRAASAGTFITLSANLAFMAPGTNIGAASPVDASGGDITGTLGVKVRNDAIASITAIAQARGRPVDWAVATVRDARSSPASEAVSVGAVDGIADSIDAVLAAANGHTVTVAGRTFSLDLAAATVREAPMNPFQGFLHLLSDPNIAFVLFVIGLVGIVIEFFHTNLVTGTVGAIALVLAFIGFGSLPLNAAGLLLVAMGVGLFILETQITSHGLLTVGGIAAFALGASALYTTPLGDPTQPIVQVAPAVIVVTTGTTAILMVLVTLAAIRSRNMVSTTGTVGVRIPIGTLGLVQAPLAPVGTAHLAGEAWSARTADGRPLPRETRVRLVSFDGLTAIVERVDNGPSKAPAASASADRP